MHIGPERAFWSFLADFGHSHDRVGYNYDLLLMWREGMLIHLGWTLFKDLDWKQNPKVALKGPVTSINIIFSWIFLTEPIVTSTHG